MDLWSDPVAAPLYSPLQGIGGADFDFGAAVCALCMLIAGDYWRNGAWRFGWGRTQHFAEGCSDGSGTEIKNRTGVSWRYYRDGEYCL